MKGRIWTLSHGIGEDAGKTTSACKRDVRVSHPVPRIPHVRMAADAFPRLPSPLSKRDPFITFFSANVRLPREM